MAIADKIPSERSELRAMLALAGPLVLTELGWMAMGVADTMVVGRVSTEAIGAVSLGTTVFYIIAVFAGGLLWGMDTLVSQAFGAEDLEDCRHTLMNGLWLAVLLVPCVLGAVWLFIPLLARLGINPDVLPVAVAYLRALVWSAPPLLIFFALRRYLQSRGVVRPIMVTLFLANVANLAGNWLLVFGHWGAPRMGAPGSAWATVFSRILMMGSLGYVAWRLDPEVFSAAWKPDWARMRRLIALGAPAAAQITLESSVFGVVTMLVGHLSGEILAGHQIALATVSCTYMMPLGVSSAAAVRVGHAIGRRDAEAARKSGWSALGLGAALMSSAALALLLFPRFIARLFTPEVAIIAAAVPLLRIAAFFQLFDGLQVVATGALRGVGDTRTPMWCHLAGYWGLGLPAGIGLGFGASLGASGLWMGLSAGLILIGMALVGFWSRKANRLQRMVQ